jgi:hypothetical protein
MVQSMMTIASTMPAATTIGTAIAVGNIIDPENELGNATPKVWSISTELHQVRYMTYGHQQKIFPSGRNGSVGGDALRHRRQRHPGGG